MQEQQKRRAAADVFMEQNVLVNRDMDELEKPAQPANMPSIVSLGLDNAQYAQEINPADSKALGGSPGSPAGPYAMTASTPALSRPATFQRRAVAASRLKTSEELQLEKEPIRVRETGWWLWKRVVVPPNVYVVHTRLGREEPVTIGLGQSFRINPSTDAYMVVPAAMQTIGVVANCISKEKQGINVLAYVQWQINNFAVAYRRLDFSDTRDPLGIVNAQLREQAEAAIKDKIATMSVEEVLTDKEPVIEELTNRLKTVAEGRNHDTKTDNDGLGIKIVTVQIKEAFVSSHRLWQDLQAPFRYEQAKFARISFLTTQDDIRQKEMETRQVAETSEAEIMVNIERTKQTKQTEALQLRLNEEGVRFNREQENVQQRLQLEEQTTRIRFASETRLQTEKDQAEQTQRLEKLRLAQEQSLEQARLNSEADLRLKSLQIEQALQELAENNRLAEDKAKSLQDQLKRDTQLRTEEAAFKLLTQQQQDELQILTLQANLTRKRLDNQLQLETEEAAQQLKYSALTRQTEIERLQQETRNLIGERDLANRLVEKLPALAAEMPEIHELKVLQTSGSDGAFDALSTFLTKILALTQTLGIPIVNNSSDTEDDITA